MLIFPKMRQMIFNRPAMANHHPPVTRRSFWNSLARIIALCSAIFCGVLTAAPPPSVANFETRVLTTPVQSNGNQWNAVTFTRVFRDPPVVVMGPATQVNGEQCVLRVRNVTTTGFEYQIDEWDYLNGYHPAETVHFLAFSEGTHQLGAQRWQVGRLSAVNRAAQSANLNGFSSAPVVLAQVETTINQAATTGTKGVKALKTRLSNVTSNGFQVSLQTQEADTGSLSNEGIGWIAVSQGEGLLDGAMVHAVRTSASIGHAFSAVTFPTPVLPFTRVNPVLIGQTQTMNQVDPGELKMRNLTATGVELRYQEEISLDPETSHAAEEVGYVVIGEVPGETLAKIETGDLLLTQSDATAWTTVPLANTFTTPVVMVGPASYTSGAALTVRVRNVTSSSFQIQLDRWDHYTTQAHNVLERVDYLVMEAGSYAIGGQLWQAGRRTVTSAAGVTQTLSVPYTAAPAVFSQVATRNDARALQSRVSAVTPNQFFLELQKSEIDTSAHVNEAVHWLAAPYGTSNLFSIARRLEIGLGTNHDSGFRTRTFSRMHADPFLFAAMQTKNDPDPATVRWRYLFANRVDLIMQEDAHPGANNSHSAETTAYLVIQGEEDSDGDGAPDDWELANNLNPNNAADGSLDPDGDLLTHQMEYHNRLNFTTSTNPFTFTGGVVTASVVTSNGFEVNDLSVPEAERVGTNARVRVNRTGGFAPITVNLSFGGTPLSNTNRTPASAADYSTWTATTGGNPVTTSVSLAANSQLADIFVRPVADGVDEYREGVRMTLSTNGTQYSLGTPQTADVSLMDSMNLSANEKLFVGTFLPQGASVTGASGFATIILNGSNTAARISTTFNGLTTPQTEVDGSHVHFSNGAIVYGDPEGLPNGQLVDYPWNIVDSGGFKGVQIVDALFRKNAGEFLYVNVHTDRYAGGEIRADLARATGSVEFVEPPATPVLEDLPNDPYTIKRDVARFLIQASFGPSEAEIDTLYNAISSANGGKGMAINRINAYSNWINTQWGREQTRLYDYHYAADQQEWHLWGQSALLALDGTNVGNPPNTAADWTRWSASVGTPPIPAGRNKESYDPDHNNRRRAWWLLANQAHDQLRQRTAFALEQIFVVSDRDTTIRNRAYAHSRYYDMLADFADGVRHLQPPLRGHPVLDPNSLIAYTPRGTSTTITMKELLMDISKHAVMAWYLSHLRNRKAEGDLSPDENYAREIMQLFSIGLMHLHPDGTLKLASNGQPIPTYTNDDIKELARVFTGWSLAWRQNTAASNYEPPLVETSFYSSNQLEYFQPGWENPLKNFAADHHDLGAKSLFVGTAQATTLRAKTSTEDAEVYANGDLDRAVTALFNHPNTAPFISRLLIQRFVTSNPSRGYVHRVAKIFERHNGTATGVRGRIRETVRAILLDYEARTLTNVDPQQYLVAGVPTTSVNVSFGKVKEPIIRYTQLQRAFGARSQLPVAALSTFGYAATQLDNFPANVTRYRYSDTVADLGQTPNNMPSVFNWYLPSYSPGGNISNAGLVAPEMQILTENLAIRSVNYLRTLSYGAIIDPTATLLPGGQGVGGLMGHDAAHDNIFTDVSALVTAYQQHRTTSGDNLLSAEWLVDKLDAILCAGSLKSKYGANTSPNNPRAGIINQVALISPTATSPPPLANCGNRVRAALYLITVSPEFVVQK
jgi:uncharacterized protein (DUF1800 family)